MPFLWYISLSNNVPPIAIDKISNGLRFVFQVRWDAADEQQRFDPRLEDSRDS